MLNQNLELLIEDIENVLLLAKIEKKQFPKNEVIAMIHHHLDIMKTIIFSEQNKADKRIGFTSSNNELVIIQSNFLLDFKVKKSSKKMIPVLYAIVIHIDVKDPIKKITNIAHKNSSLFKLFFDEIFETVN
jgi:hypothetical protein